MELTIHDLDEDVLRRLRQRALRNARSLQAEARSILSDAVAESPPEILTRIDALRERLRGRVSGDSTDIIRAARDA